MTVETFMDFMQLPKNTAYELIKCNEFKDKIAFKEPGKKSWVIDETKLRSWIVEHKELAKNGKKN